MDELTEEFWERLEQLVAEADQMQLAVPALRSLPDRAGVCLPAWLSKEKTLAHTVFYNEYKQLGGASDEYMKRYMAVMACIALIEDVFHENEEPPSSLVQEALRKWLTGEVDSLFKKRAHVLGIDRRRPKKAVKTDAVVNFIKTYDGGTDLRHASGEFIAARFEAQTGVHVSSKTARKARDIVYSGKEK